MSDTSKIIGGDLSANVASLQLGSSLLVFFKPVYSRPVLKVKNQATPLKEDSNLIAIRGFIENSTDDSIKTRLTTFLNTIEKFKIEVGTASETSTNNNVVVSYFLITDEESSNDEDSSIKATWTEVGASKDSLDNEFIFRISGSKITKPGILRLRAHFKGAPNLSSLDSLEIPVLNESDSTVQVPTILSTIANKNQFDINVQSPSLPQSPLSVLFKGIVDSTNRISFNDYKKYVDLIFCKGEDAQGGYFNQTHQKRFLPFNDTDNYRVLKAATESFLMLQSGVCGSLEKWSEGENDEVQGVGKLKPMLLSKKINVAASDDESIHRLWKDYLVREDGIMILPFLYLIRQKFSDLNFTTTWIDNQIENECCKKDVNSSILAAECFELTRQRLQYPLFLELLWSYWQEEGMLVQTMNAISMRFQNMKSGSRDPLSEMEISHLRPLNNVLWGYIQDQQHLLSVKRRAYEYDHHYGITLQGKAVSTLNSADSRVRFIGAFHTLLNTTAKYYVESANKLVEPDTFPILNALRDVHFIIAEGMHNQYGDLPTTARQEMLIQQWILAQPEFGQFLPGRSAIPFTEPWMDRVAAMNRLQGWSDTSPMHFDNLAKFGEQILLSIRFADWSSQSRSADEATLWAKFFRSQIQGYIHSYKAATGVDLNALQVGTEVDSQAPAVHLVKRTKVAQNGNIPQPRQNGVPVKRTIDKESY